MVRREPVRRAVLTALCAACATVSAAQGLGETARKTDEARKKGGTPAIVIKDLPPPPADTGPVRLSEAVVRRYGEARVAIAILRYEDPKMNVRLNRLRQKAERYEDQARHYEAESAVAVALSDHGFTADSYMEVEVALLRGRTVPRGLQIDRYIGRDRENIEFVLANAGLASEVWDRCLGYEGRLRIWIGVIPDYY